MSRRFVRKLVRGAALGAGCVVVAGSASAATLHYWRFEDSPGFLNDSVGGVTLTAGAGVTQVAIPDGIRGADFPLGAEAANAPGTGTGYLQGVLPSALTSSFTVEALVHGDSFGGFYGDLIAGTVTDPTLATNIGWMFHVRLDNFSGSATRELVIALAQGGSFSFVRSTFVLDPGVDYYVAAAVDIPGGTVTFYRQNLTTNGPLQSSVASHTRTALNGSTALRIGATTIGSFYDFAFDGLIDEVRISSGVVPASGLLLAPEPATAGLVALGLGVLALRRRRN